MSVLWITPKWPLPADDGARQATVQLVSALCERGVDVNLRALVPKDEAVSEQDAVATLGVRSARVLRRPNPGRGLHLRNLLRDPSRALTLSQYVTRELRAALAEETAHPGVTVVFDGLHAAAWLRDPEDVISAPIIYRAHNVESDIWFRGADQRRGMASALLRWQGRAVRDFELALCRASTLVCTVSDSDRDRLREQVPSASVGTLPIGMEPKPQRTAPADDRRLLFVGRLDWPPNREGLEWLLERVWPRVERPYTLTIVGSGDGSWIKPYLAEPRVRFLGRVDTLTPYYHESIASLVPVFYGSGTRVKAIESSLYATPCLGTELGVEGVGLDPTRDYFRAETVDEWVNALNDLDAGEARHRGENALARVTSRYDAGRVAEEFLRMTRGYVERRRRVA